MKPTDSDLLLCALAIRTSLLTEVQVKEALCRAGDEKRGVEEVLVEGHFLSPDEVAALEGMAGSILVRFGGDLQRAFAQPTPRLGSRGGPGVDSPTTRLPERFLELLQLLAPTQTPASAPEAAAEDRYEVQGEIGRGGLGVVVAARDRTLGRPVALKMVRADADVDAMKRFLLEARLTGQLEHPNIVPVHDLGTWTGAEGERHAYFCMKYVRGRNLWQVIRALGSGDAETQRRFTRTRLLQMFQDVCMGVAFAHDHGVLHRDLKPSNVMVGDYGETLLVDWGLARVKGKPGLIDEASLLLDGGEGAAPAGAAPALAPQPGRIEAEPALLTQAGDVLGTPSYMPPEQAEGRNDEVDERSDIYSLGAILYEILTYRPPYEGSSFSEVVTRVVSGALVPPSRRVHEDSSVRILAAESEAHGRAAGAASAGAGEPESVEGEEVADAPAWMPSQPPDPVPPELEAICMRALSRKKDDRYRSARELHDEIQLYLEGVQERERKRREADAKVAAGERLAAGLAAARGRLRAAERELRQLIDTIEGWAPLEEKRRGWALEDREQALRLECVTLFADANACFTEALGFDPSHAGARAGKARLYWDKFADAEAGGDAAGMLLHRKLIEQYDDGTFAARLQGDGRLAVRATTWACRCLEEGRAHATACRRAEVQGAEVTLYRYVEKDRILVPSFPEGVLGAVGARPDPDEAGSAAGAAAAARAGLPSPRPGAGGLFLGRTPTATVRLPMGSYLLVVSHAEHRALRVPVQVTREQSVELSVTLCRPEAMPEGMVAVAGGPAILGADPGAVQPERRVPELPDFFLAELPVTCGEYLEFLNDLAARDPVAARARAPRLGGERPQPCWVAGSDGRWRLPAPEEGALATPAGKLAWDPRWPVVGVSWHDAMAFAAWRGARARRPFTLPTEHQWEKAARGVDGRFFPWGNAFDSAFCRMATTEKTGARIVPVGSMPTDESPYGARDLAGNVREWCLNEDEEGRFPGYRMMRGGMWSLHPQYCRAAYRSGAHPDRVGEMLGFRLCLNQGEMGGTKGGIGGNGGKEGIGGKEGK